MRPGDSKRNWAAMCDESSLGLVPSKSESHEFRYLKRPNASPPTCYSNFTMNIDDFPDPLLFEILLRLPVKSAARFKCVSRRWLALISHHTFLSRFLCLQRDKRNPLPMEPALIFSDDKGFFATTSQLSIFETGSFSLDFLPCYQSARDNRLELDSPVLASCNDLVLWCASKMLQRQYYICNPYTKQWTALPPSPQCSFEVRVGFICEPYYYYKEDVDHHRSEEDSNSISTCSSSSTVQLNVDYKYAIVRILSPILMRNNCSELNVEIFTSETGKWTESVVSCPPYLCFDELPYERPGLPYKGKLYWPHDGHCNFMIALDPFSNNNHFDVVHLPRSESGRAITVSQEGRLRLYRTLLDGDRGGPEPLRKGLSIWELTDDEYEDKADGRVRKWSKIDTLPLGKMVSENPLITEWSRSSEVALEIAFDPSNDDILYVRSNVDDDATTIIMCNIRENTLKEVTTINGRLESVFRYMVPWWPTPVPKIDYNHTYAAHLNSCPLCSKLTECQILREAWLSLRHMYLAYPFLY